MTTTNLNILDEYLQWIRDNTKMKSVKENDNINVITTPFLDRHNDCIEIYVKKCDDDKLILTDWGYIISDLEMSGFNYDSSEKRLQTMMVILNGFGVRMNSWEIFVEVNHTNIWEKKHSLIQAMLAINDMFVLSRENIASYFKEDVERYFSSSWIIYITDSKIMGKSWYTHSVDFIIPKSRQYPERLIKTIWHLRKDQAMNTIASFMDIDANRESISKYVIYNDYDTPWTSDSINALKNYNIEPLKWSTKEKFSSLFSL